MNYTVKQPIAIFNINWQIGDIISDYDIDRVFSQNIKENLILDNVIEEVKEVKEVKEMEIKSGYSKRHYSWNKGVYIFADKAMNSEKEYIQTESILILKPTPEIEKAIYDIMNPMKPEPELQSKKLFLRCIDNDGRKNYLTKNKIYLSEGTDDIFYFIRDDKGSREFYHSPRFQLITNKVVKSETNAFEFVTKGNYYEVTNINGYEYSIIADDNKIRYFHKSNFSEVQ